MNSLDILKLKLKLAENKPVKIEPEPLDETVDDLRRKLYGLKGIDVNKELDGVPFVQYKDNMHLMKTDCPYMKTHESKGETRHRCMEPDNVRDFVHGRIWKEGSREYTTIGQGFRSCRSCSEAPEFMREK